jgi:hypothetical protein
MKTRIRHSSFVIRHSERGVALVITLIMLAVITFMAVTFLVVSRSERGSVATQTDMTMARLAADTARDRAIAEMLAPMLAGNNPFNYGLLVSTNYINLNGFNPTALPEDLSNVNYDFTTTGTALTLAEQLQNLQNLFFNPRPPVFVVTNALAIVSNDFRFYVDLNRNGMFDPTGFFSDTNNPPWSPPWPHIGPVTWHVGDPQWIGILQHPEYYHSPTNTFTSRFAYLVVPIGQALDMNMMHNYAKGPSLIPGNQTLPWPDGFLRNQGILPAELNLAGFLVDLNTNAWPYPERSPNAPFNNFTPYAYYTNCYPNNPVASTGAAADDAAAFVRYRYATNVNSLANVRNLFNQQGANAFSFNPMDAYSEGPLMTGTSWPPPGVPNPNSINPTRVLNNYPWAGADSPNRFYTLSDLFDRSKFPTGSGGKPGGAATFVYRLTMAGSDTNLPYNQYTFYRLLSQLGTDSAPEPADKMNLNYCNVDKNGAVIPNAETGFTNWVVPVQFFTNAVIRLMVDAGYTVGPGSTVRNTYSTSNLLVTNFIGGVWVTNLQIPIWPTNYYTPSLHRLLQLAANLYDATTNRGINPGTDPGYPTSPAYPYLPTVFRPLFNEVGHNQAGQRQVFVNAYSEVTSKDLTAGGKFGSPFNGSRLPHDLSDANDISTLGTVQQYDMVYNVPVVIGARKGLPSFDELTADTQVQAARKLIYHRQNDATNQPINEIDPAYFLTVTNVVGLQAWNSYPANYMRPVQLYAWPDTEVLITNLQTGKQLNPPGYPSRLPLAPTYYPPTTPWPGFNTTFPGSSFVTPLGPLGSPTTNYVFLPTNSVYLYNSQQFDASGLGQPNRTPGNSNNLFNIPHFQLTVKSRLRFTLVDQQTQRLLDYVNLAANQTVDITTNLVDSGCGLAYYPVYSRGGMWCTNTAGGDPRSFGIRLQIDVSAGRQTTGTGVDWTSSLPDPIYGRDLDKGVARFNAQFGSNVGLGGGSSSGTAYPLISPFAAPYSPFRNMQLVHYTVGDLQDMKDLPQSVYLDDQTPALPPTSFGTINRRYEPWGDPRELVPSQTATDWRLKDPVAKQYGNSDSWDFTTNKFPSVGWLGRVHRGTPWQTVYLKSSPIDYKSWIVWSGNNLVVTNFGQLAQNMPQWVSTTNIIGRVTNIYQVANDCAFTHPTNDWRVLDLFSTAFDANATRGRMSINQTNLAAWSAVLSGVIALTNGGNGVLSPWVIPPAGVYNPNPAVSNTWPAIVRIVNAINTVRSNTANPTLPVFANQVFHRLGDLLSVPELTVASPFLSPTPVPIPFNPNVNVPFSDAAMERIPQQILGLLKADSTPRFVIYSFGQTLKPANHSRVTSGSFFGLVTNYQITAEVATRTVVRFDGVPPYQFGVAPVITNLHPVIESFNVLPPD